MDPFLPRCLCRLLLVVVVLVVPVVVLPELLETLEPRHTSSWVRK